MNLYLKCQALTFSAIDHSGYVKVNSNLLAVNDFCSYKDINVKKSELCKLSYFVEFVFY